MDVPQDRQKARDAGRRRFIRLAALGVAGAGLWAFLRGRLPPSGRRSMPKDLPGEGSIFQPREDPRSRAS